MSWTATASLGTCIEELLAAIRQHFLESRDFNGLVVSRFTEESGRTWPEIKAALADLLRSGRITLNFAEMNPFVKNFPDAPLAQQLEQLARLDCPGILCAYPTAVTVRDAALTFADRPFSQMLALGRGHLELFFFDLAVLEMYASDPRYHFEFRCYNGWISIRDEYCCDVDTRDRDKIYLKSFGLAYDPKEHRVLAVYLGELAKLSPEHQQYWRTKQISDECKVVKEYLDNTLGGIWVETGSFYGALLHEQAEINKLCGIIGRPPLFRETFEQHWPAGYSIFFRSTKRNFLSFVHTLDKLLCDNINKRFFCGEVEDREIVELPDGTRESKPLGTLRILKQWLGERVRFSEPDGLDRLMAPLREVRDLRSRNAHQLVIDQFDHKYQQEQDRLVVDVYFSLASLRHVLATHPEASDYKAPSFLNPEKLRVF